MRTEPTTTRSVLFPELFDKPLVTQFDQQRGSSDGGAVLLKAADRRLGLTQRLAACLRDERQAGKVTHELIDLLCQRVFAIACGYPDANDASRLAQDPVHKLLLGRDPIEGEPLASQPTLSRFENSMRRGDLYRMGETLADVVVERHRRRLRGKARRLTIDLDSTDDPTHGAQQLSFFNTFYGTWCYQPLLGFVRFNDEADQHAFCAVLRPGNSSGKRGALGIVRRVVQRLRRGFPKARVFVRLDSAFACPELLDWLDEAGVEYTIAVGENAVLLKYALKALRKARRLSRRSGQSERVYTQCRYRARTWPRRRRVIIKAEVVRHPGRKPRDNPRFVVTNLPADARAVYERQYCPRGDIENRIKELQYGLDIDRTSCSRFWANQLRVLLTLAAYVLLQELRLCAAGTTCARAQVSTLRERLIKLGAHLLVSVRRVVLHLPAAFPFLRTWRRVAIALGATP